MKWRKQNPDNTKEFGNFFFLSWITVSSVKATSCHQSTRREHDAIISANKPFHVVHHNDNTVTECSCLVDYKTKNGNTHTTHTHRNILWFTFFFLCFLQKYMYIKYCNFVLDPHFISIDVKCKWWQSAICWVNQCVYAFGLNEWISNADISFSFSSNWLFLRNLNRTANKFFLMFCGWFCLL